MPKTQHLIKFNQIEYFIALFNRGGYVLNFSTHDFNRFTINSVGIALCQKYNLSKGKSLEAFLDEGNESDVIKLLSDLLEYYEVWCQEEVVPEGKCYSKENAELYKKCREILDILSNKNPYIAASTKSIKVKFSSEYLHKQIDLMMDMIDKNPTEAIGKSKELIETCCKNILENEDVIYDLNADLNSFVKLTMQTLDVHVSSIRDNSPEYKTIKKILGSLSGIASSVVELRNRYGSGHGKNIDYKGLSSRHAELAVGSSVTLVKYLWNTYEWRRNYCQKIETLDCGKPGDT